ncbi:MAG: M14 family zinc carboxypeptidase [Gemmatimonadota bacterium]|nr:M14 family zinc carboxypeptidase [Gemmatimonadota bacterium]
MIRAALLTVLLSAPVAAAAQAPTGFMPDGIDYDPGIVTPAEAFGHELGERPTRYGQLVSYFEHIAGSSDRVAIDTLGHSVEGRPIVRLTVTDPSNHARLDEIRARHLAATTPDASGTDADLPVVVWLGFGVHGAEAAGLEASAPLIHHLAAGRGEEIERVLSNSVLLVVAALNPDGHARRIDHSLSFTSRTVVRNGDHAGHDLWTRQRANHYGFDLNRQWLLLAQQEARVWVPAWHEWKPHFSTDFHEMGTTSVRPSTYFFSPGDPVRTNRLTPEPVRPLLDRISEYHEAALDDRGTLYFTDEVYNSFYPGSGSSYPNLNGSLGSLFEVGTAHLIELDTPLGLWSLAENIDVHFRSTLTSIAAAVDLKDELRSYRGSFREIVLEQARQDDRGGFVFASPDKARLARFVELLETHEIEVRGLARDLTLDGVEYRAGDALVVPLEQEAYLVVRTLFDRVTDFEAPSFSDATAWTLPLTFGLDHAVVPQGQMSPELLAARPDPVRPAPPTPDRASYGYAFSWTDHYAPRALFRVLDAGLIAQAAMVPVTIETTRGAVELERGSVFVPLGRQESSAEDIHALMTRLAAEDGIEVHAVASGNTLDEGANFGNAGAFGTLRRPEVLLLFEGGVQRFDMGHVWHLLDAQMGMPVVLKQKDRIGEIDWSAYTHIILPGGRDVGLSEAATVRLDQWIREEGGTFIALRQGAEWAQEALLGRAPITERTIALEPGERFDYEELRLRQSEDVVSGAIFSSDLDVSHPLGFGFHRRTLPSHRDTSIRLVTPENPVATVARYHDEPLLAGYASERRQREIGGSPMLVAERLGAGSVVLMTDNPNFRGVYLGTNKLLMNGLFFSALFNAPSSPGGARFRP